MTQVMTLKLCDESAGTLASPTTIITPTDCDGFDSPTPPHQKHHETLLTLAELSFYGSEDDDDDDDDKQLFVGHQSGINSFCVDEHGMRTGVIPNLDASSRNTVSNDPEVTEHLNNTPLFGSTLYLANYMTSERQNRLKATAAEPEEEKHYEDERMYIKQDTATESDRLLAKSLHSHLNVNAVITPFISLRPSSRSDKKPFFLSHIRSGSLQQSIIAACCIALVNGVACWLFYETLEAGLEFIWHTLPKVYLPNTWLMIHYAWLWIPIVSYISCIAVGLVVKYVGEPGDLAFAIACIHQKAYIPLNHVHPMILASPFSILAGGSLGPEAPLVAICGALAGFVSRRVLVEHNRGVARKHTLMGTAGALSAFFGIPLGGSLFALEVNSRFGVEYYEHTAEAIFCGELTLLVFRTLARLPIQPIWSLGVPPRECDVKNILVGAVLGLVGAGLAYGFATFHLKVMGVFSSLGLLDNSRAISRALLGGTGIIVIGLLVPQTLFWSEYEFQNVVMREPATQLPHVWPTTGLMGFELDTTWKVLLTGLLKLAAISFTVASGLRGGFIFPLMCAGGLVGRALADWTGLSLSIGILSVAAGLNTAITRTVLATPIILCFLAGESVALPIVLMASLSSLFVSSTLGFIKTQMARSDLDHNMFHRPPKASTSNHNTPAVSMPRRGESETNLLNLHF